MDAQVACRQLGYGTNGTIAYGSAKFGWATGDILLDNLNCSGTENTLFECDRDDKNLDKCYHFKDAGVFCPRKQIIITTVS